MKNLGLTIFWVSVAALFGYGIFELISSFFLKSDEPLMIKLGITGLILGILLMLISLVFERISDKKSEHFKL
jgi:hypothetical protein